jgi:hypothetical protein
MIALKVGLNTLKGEVDLSYQVAFLLDIIAEI